MAEKNIPFGFFLENAEQAQKVFKIANTKGPYRILKREKKIWRDKADILFEADEDEIAFVSCVLQKGALIAWNVIVTKQRNVMGYEESQLAYLCVKRDGIWFYPLEVVAAIVQQEGNKIQVLASQKEDCQRARKFVENLISLPKETFDDFFFSSNTKTLTPIEED